MTRNHAKIIGASMLAVGVLLLCSLPLAAQDHNTYLQHAERFAVSPPLRDLAKLPPPSQYTLHQVIPLLRPPTKRAFGQVVDTVEQSSVSGSGSNYSVGMNFPGITDAQNGPLTGHLYIPADTNMAVGDTQIVQWVNVIYEVLDKSGNVLAGPFTGNSIWTALGGVCAANNSGDPIAQWDVVAHRWVLAQNVFSPPYKVCVAVSTGSDAAGSYYLYQFPVVNNGFPDYPKWGIWTNDYGQGYNNFGPDGSTFQGGVWCIYNRTKLLVGDQSAEQICHQYSNNEDTLMPADLDSPTLPPSGEDQFAIGSLGDVDNSHLSLYSVHINDPNNWSMGATFTGDNNSQQIPVPSFTPLCDFGACVPQKGVGNQLDTLSGALMYRFAYWEDQPSVHATATPPLPAPSQHWLINHSVQANGGQGGVRWYEFTAPIRRVPVTSLSIFQSGTYAPDSQWRWMGSIARDKVGDILLGYSESSSNQYPSIYVAGRQVNDPLGLGQLEPEVQVVAGTGSQTDYRWGDYSSMRIDTNDGMHGCTFWYTTEYYPTTSDFNWVTQVNSAKFSNCN